MSFDCSTEGIMLSLSCDSLRVFGIEWSEDWRRIVSLKPEWGESFGKFNILRYNWYEAGWGLSKWSEILRNWCIAT